MQKTPVPRAKKVTNAMQLAGARPALRAIESIISTWNSPNGPEADPQDIVGLQGFFLGYDRVCKNSGMPFDASIADEILDRMHHDKPVSSADIHTLHVEAHKLLRAARSVRSIDIWLESLQDMEIYCHVHGWQWKGIGRAPAGFSAGVQIAA
jgi:hypothetical protein